MSFDWVGDGQTAKGVSERRFDVVRETRRIPGVVWTPEEPTAAPPLVLLGHGGSGHKREEYLVALARRLVRHHGFAAAAIDGPVHGERRGDGGTDVGAIQAEFAQIWRDDPTMTDEMVADWRATLDALQSPAVLGAAPVGWWGLSMGTILGLPVVAAEPRISVAVLGLMGIVGPTKQRLAQDAAAVQCPVFFVVQWDDELFARDRAFDLFSAIGTRDKRLHANPGRHVEVPLAEFVASEQFIAKRLATRADPRVGRAFEPLGTVGGMREVVCRSFGPLDDLVIEERPSVDLAAGQVRVRVTAAGVNFVDALLVQGLYQIKPPLPFVAGGESVGVVSEIGAGVTDRAVGERVLITSGVGGFATEMVVPAARVSVVPPSLTDGQAATFMQSYMTAYFALVHRARMQPGQSLLVLGAGGGVGLAAVDVGRALGLTVIAAASSADKREVAHSRGARQTIDSASEDVKARARKITGDGVDAVYDPVGGPLGEACLRALREDGQFLVIGFASGAIPNLPANQVLLRNRRVTGVDWGAWAGRNVAANQELVDRVVALITGGELQPVEPVSYPFDEAARALSDQQHRNVVGKAVLVP